jgi:hypothetical protein
MGFINSIKKALFSPSEKNINIEFQYVRCSRCNEVLKTRVDLIHDLSATDEGFMTRKVLIGSNRCFQQIELILTYDNKRRIKDRSITNGNYISADEYESSKTQTH